MENQASSMTTSIQTLLQLNQEAERQTFQYDEAFNKMYGQHVVTAASKAIAGENCFYGLWSIDAELQTLPAHQALLNVYHKLQTAKQADFN